MDFKKATDGLFEGVSHEDLARALGVSVATVRQARLDPRARAHRAPPPNWMRAVLTLAQQQAARYQGLIEELCSGNDVEPVQRLSRDHKKRGRNN